MMATRAVPETVEAVQVMPAKTLVLDGEVIAMRPDGAPEPFQVTMRRFGRKASDLRAEIPLSPYFFDIIHADGSDILDLPYGERLKALRALVPVCGRYRRWSPRRPKKRTYFA